MDPNVMSTEEITDTRLVTDTAEVTGSAPISHSYFGGGPAQYVSEQSRAGPIRQLPERWIAEQEARGQITLVGFDVAKSELLPEHKRQLTAIVARFARQAADLTVEKVEGRASETPVRNGKVVARLNEQYSQERAANTAQYLYNLWESMQTPHRFDDDGIGNPKVVAFGSRDPLSPATGVEDFRNRSARIHYRAILSFFSPPQESVLAHELERRLQRLVDRYSVEELPILEVETARCRHIKAFEVGVRVIRMLRAGHTRFDPEGGRHYALELGIPPSKVTGIARYHVAAYAVGIKSGQIGVGMLSEWERLARAADARDDWHRLAHDEAMIAGGEERVEAAYQRLLADPTYRFVYPGPGNPEFEDVKKTALDVDRRVFSQLSFMDRFGVMDRITAEPACWNTIR